MTKKVVVFINPLSIGTNGQENFNNTTYIEETFFLLNNEKRLIKDLFSHYEVRQGRPVNNVTEKVLIYFGLYLIQLVNLVCND